METIGWIVIGWFAAAFLLSLALGGFLRKVGVTPGEDDLVVAASKQKVMRYMRGRKPAVTRCNLEITQLNGARKRSSGSAG